MIFLSDANSFCIDTTLSFKVFSSYIILVRAVLLGVTLMELHKLKVNPWLELVQT